MSDASLNISLRVVQVLSQYSGRIGRENNGRPEVVWLNVPLLNLKIHLVIVFPMRSEQATEQEDWQQILCNHHNHLSIIPQLLHNKNITSK